MDRFLGLEVFEVPSECIAYVPGDSMAAIIRKNAAVLTRQFEFYHRWKRAVGAFPPRSHFWNFWTSSLNHDIDAYVRSELQIEAAGTAAVPHTPASTAEWAQFLREKWIDRVMSPRHVVDVNDDVVVFMKQLISDERSDISIADIYDDVLPCTLEAFYAKNARVIQSWKLLERNPVTGSIPRRAPPPPQQPWMTVAEALRLIFLRDRHFLGTLRGSRCVVTDSTPGDGFNVSPFRKEYLYLKLSCDKSLSEMIARNIPRVCARHVHLDDGQGTPHVDLSVHGCFSRVDFHALRAALMERLGAPWGERWVKRAFDDIARGSAAVPAVEFMRDYLLLSKNRDFLCDLDEPAPAGAVVAVDSRQNLLTASAMMITMQNLDLSQWRCYIVTTRENFTYYSDIKGAKVLDMRDLVPLDVLETIDDYNKLLMDARFWRHFGSLGHRIVLTIQDDGFLVRPGLETFVRDRFRGYEYVGAPWKLDDEFNRRFLSSLASTDLVGNGGLSLRSIEACARACEEHRDGRARWLFIEDLKPVNEDVFFSGVLKTCPRDVALEFSFEQDISRADVALGFHKFWPYHSAPEVRKLFAGVLEDRRLRILSAV